MLEGNVCNAGHRVERGGWAGLDGCPSDNEVYPEFKGTENMSCCDGLDEVMLGSLRYLLLERLSSSAMSGLCEDTL